MTWPFSSRAVSAESLLGDRTVGRTSAASTTVARSTALRQSAVWACLRLRADLISTMPVDVFKRVNGVQVEQKKPPVFLEPGGRKCRWTTFVESTTRDLDSVGNTVGIITARDGFGLPARIELQPIESVSIRTKARQISEFVIDGKSYDPGMIWHEKQYTLAGVPVGLSPIAHAALTINTSLSAQEFAARWFDNSATAAAHLRNTAKTLKPGEAAKVKRRFKAMMSDGDLFVSGKDWEYNMLSASAADSKWLEQTDAGLLDVCRYLGVPGDMIDASADGSSITYANITQRNLQLLIMNLGPAIARREEAWSFDLLPRPRYVKLNPNALLRMDLKSRYEGYKIGVDGRWLPPSRILDLENMPPLTPEEEAEFARLFPAKTPTPDGSRP